MQIQNQRVKMYVTKEINIVNSIYSIHAKIWVQNKNLLQNIIKHLEKFTLKHKEKYGICFLKNPKTVSTVIDLLCNKCVNYQYFVNMRQGTLEGDDRYIKWVTLAIETLILDGGFHVLCSLDIFEAVDQAKPLEKEATSEEDKLSAIDLLQTSDPVRYGNLNKELHNVPCAGRDKYSPTSGVAYKLMVHRSGRYQSIVDGGNGGGRRNSNGR